MKIAKTINKVELPDNWIRVEQGDIAVQTSNGMEYKPKEYIGVADENISVYYDADATFTDDTESTLNIILTTLIISKKPGNTGISRDIRTEFTTDLLLSD